MAEVNFSIVSPTGEVLPLASEVNEPGDFRLMNGVAGFGTPGLEVTYSSPVGDGTTVRSWRTDGRTLDVPIGVRATDRINMNWQTAALENAVLPIAGLPFPKLRATWLNGVTWELPFMYEAGFADTYGSDGDQWHVWPLQLKAPHPWWRRTTPEMIILGASTPTTPLLNNLITIPLAEGDSFGSSTVDNPGQLPVTVDWELQGAFTSVTIIAGDEGFTYTAAVPVGGRRYIRRVNRTFRVEDETGASKFTDLTFPAKFPILLPGTREIQVTMTGTEPGVSRVIGTFYPEYRSIF